MTDDQRNLSALLLGLVDNELRRAMTKFAPFNSPHEGWAVIREELDELWEHVKANTGGSEKAQDEAIQLAAMALRYAYDIFEWGPSRAE